MHEANQAPCQANARSRDLDDTGAWDLLEKAI